MTDLALVPVERIERAILVLRGNKVMLDADLAALYEVDTRVLLQAVKRNADRFPADFMFQLTLEEAQRSRSQSVILNGQGPAIAEVSRSQSVTLKRGTNLKYLPYAFTEQGVAMLSSVLRSPRGPTLLRTSRFDFRESQRLSTSGAGGLSRMPCARLPKNRAGAGFSTSMGFEMLFLGLRGPSLKEKWRAPSRARCGSAIGMHRTCRRSSTSILRSRLSRRTARVCERHFSDLRHGQRQRQPDFTR